MEVLSLQSRVAYGHVGNAAAAPALHRLGHRVWQVDTTLLSNHLGYSTYGGRMLASEEVAAVLDGLGKLGLYDRLDALLSGFLGTAVTAAASAVAELRRANPRALFCFDPVMGERNGGLYVKPETAAAMAAELLPEADILLPNAFELDYLAGARTRTLAEVREAVARVRARARPGAIMVATGLDREDGPARRIEALVVGPEGAWLGEVPRFDAPPHGGGDLFAALFLGYYLKRRELPWALAHAMDSTHVAFTASVGQTELALVESLEAMGHPPMIARISRLA